MAIASSTPSPTPRVDPSSPTTNASNSTDRVTCLLEAPRARSRASSRLRWATRIENVLTMMNAPTTREMPAKISRKVRRKPIASSRSDAASSAASSPVTASYPSGRTASTWSRSSDWETPGFAVTHRSVNSSRPPRKRFCAVAVSKAAYVAPLSEPPSGKSRMPTSFGVSSAWSAEVTMCTFSPMKYPDRCAVLASKTTSSGPFGGRPWVRVRPVSPCPAGASP